MFERFTDRARRVVVLAQEESRLLNHQHIGTEHILLGLIHEGEGVAAQVLESLGVPLERAREQVEAIIGTGRGRPSGHIPFTPRAKKVLELSLREAIQLDHNYIGTEHILLGLVREGEGVAAQVLVKSGADLDRVRAEVKRVLAAGQAVDEPSGERLIAFERAPSVEEIVRREELRPRAVAGAYKEPVCPTCKGSLARTARIKVLDVPDSEGGVHPVRLVFCSACGESLLAADTDPPTPV